MPINQKVKQIYDTLKGGGADVGTEQEFNDWFLAKGDQGYQNRKNVYTTLRDGGADAGNSYEEFRDWLNLKPTPAAVQHNNSAGVSPSTPAASKPKQNTFFGQMRNPVGMMVDKVSEVPKRNQLPQPKYAQQISQDDIARYNQTIAGAYSTARRANEQTDNILEYSKQRINNPLGQADAQLGEVNDRPSLAGSKNLVKGDVEYNPETGKLEQSYLTQAGSKHYNKGLAEMEQQQIDKARWEQLHPVEVELEEAYAERDRLLQEQEDAAKNVRENTDETALAQYAAYNEGNPYWSIDKRYTDYDSALRENKSRIKLLEEKKRGKEAGFWAGFMDTTTDPDTWLFGIPGLIDSGKLYGIKEKMDSGMKLSKSEESLIAETAKGVQAEQRYGGDLPSLYRWGNIASAALPFVAEFMTTGGFSSVANGIAGVGERAAAKSASNAATKWLIKNTGVLAGDIASGFLMANTTGSAKIASDILNRNMGTVVQDENGKFKFVDGEGLLPSIAKAEISQTLEYYTEKLGEHLKIGKFLSKGAEKIGLSKVSKAVNYLSNNKWLSKGGVQDYPSEVFEEEANIVLNALLVGDNQLSDLWDGRTQADIWGGMVFSIGLMNAPKYANTGYQTAQYYRYKHKTNKADKLAGYKLTDEVWQPLRDEIDNTDNDEMSGVVFGIASSENLNEEQKRTALDYVKNLCEMRGYNMGLLNEFKEPDNITAVENEDANGVGNSYTQGYSSENESDMQDIKTRMEMIREGMDGLFDGDFISQLDEDPVGTLKAVRDMVSLSDTQKRMVIDYVNAKSAYDGMIQRVRDNIDSETAQSDEMINSRVASEEHGGDGMIHPATLKEGDRKVYIVSGNVLMTDDGSMVDTQRSDEDLIVRDAETGKLEFVSSGDILSTDEPLDAEQLKEEARQQIHENIAQQAVNKIDGVLSFNIGDEYDVADYNGNPHKVRVLSVDGDNVVIDMDGAERTMPQQTIQEMADMANRSRVNIESNESDEAEAFPMLENGEPDFSQAEPARTYEYLFNEDSSGIPADAADEFVSNMRKESVKMLERINNKKPKIGTNITKFKSEMEAWNAERSDAERAAAYWDSVNELRDSEKKRIADEELMDNRDHYIAESKNKSDAWNRAAQMYGDVPVANFQYDDTYDTLEEYVAENLPYHSINWNSYDVNGVKYVGLKDETGLGEAERRRFLAYLAKSGNGNSLSNVIHELWENMPENLASQGYTDHDVRNALIGLFLNAGSSKDISLYRLNNRIAAAEKFLQEEKELEENARYAAEQEIIEWQEYWETVDVSHYTEEVDSFLAEQNNKFENGTEENDGSEGLDREPATGGVSDGNQESAGTLQGEETAKSAVETDDTDTERRGRETAAAESVDNGADESIPLENGAGEKLSTLAVAEQETNTDVETANSVKLSDDASEEVEDNATYRDYDDDESGNDTYAARRWRNAHILANDWIEKLNIGDVVKVYDSIYDVPNSRQFSKRKRSAKGWYDTKTGEIVIIMGNHRGEQDVLRTILHEAVAHYGLRKLFGSNFDNFLDNVYNAANIDIKANIMSKVAVLMGKDKNSKRTADEWRRVATEEYLAELAESTDFERAESRSSVHHWFNNIKKLFLSMLHKMGLKDFGSSKNPVLTDNELRYILWRSYKNMTEPGRYRNVFQSAEDVSMQNRLGVGNYSKVGERVDMAADGISSEKDLNNTERASDIHGNSLSLQQRNKDNEISESVSQGKLGAEDAGNRRIHEISDEIRRRSGIHDSELEEGSGNGSRLEKEQRAAESIAKEEAIREMEEARENAITPDERERLNEIEIERNALKEDGKSANDDGALFRDEDSTPRALARDTYERMVMSGREQFSEAMQDSMRSLKNLYRAIIKAEGKKTYIEDVAGFENAYLAENRMSSMSQSQVHAWQKDFIEPLVKEVHRLTGGKDGAYHELLDYLMAKHGLERNVVLAGRDAQKTYEKKTSDGGTADLQEITDKFRERDYSGLTALTGKSSTEEAEDVAREMVEDYEREHDTDELWKRINAATKSSLEKTYMCGLMSRERYEQVREMFSHYVPLQGFDGKVSEDVYSYIGSDGTRMYGTPIRSAKGRKSKADNPLAAIEMNGEAAIRQGNRNIMKQRFLNFVQNHPSDLVSVSDVWLRYNDVTEEWEQFFEADLKEEDTPEEVERKMMEYEERMEKLANDFPDRYKRGSDMTGVPYRVLDKYHMKEHQVMVNRGGKTFVLTINGNPRAAQALNGVTNPDVYSDGVFGITMEMGAFLNRQLSAVYTTRNPEFVVSNYMRDAIYSNSMVWVKENPRYALKFHRNFGKMNPVFLGKLFKEWENGKLRERVAGLPYTSEISEMDYLRKRFYEFMTNGGETGWTNLRDIEKHKQDLEKALKREGSTTRKAWKAIGGCFDLVNRSVENNARFAAYLTSREMGRGIDRSIYDAKEISVNFKKKGAGDKFLGSKGQTKLGNIGATVGGAGRGLYVFWNASVQGMTNIARASSRHPFKAAGMVAALYILGYAAPLISQILCGGDDDDDYYNLPEYIRRSNICFRWRKSMPWVTIPLPIEFRAVYGLGEMAYGTITGKERYSDEEFTKQFISQISQVLPLDFMEGGGGWHAFVPSAIKPFVEAQTNVSWTGLPIYRENVFKPYEPQWKRAYNSANQQIVTATRWVNEATGGDDVEQGWIDWNPAKIEYMLKGYLGGYFTMADRLTKSAETALGKREFDWRNTPLASRLLKQGDERTEDRKIKNQYFDLQKEYEETKYLLKGYAKEAGSGREDAFKYAERLDFIHHSKEYLHYQLMEYYKPLLDAYNKLGKEADGERGKRIEAEENMLRREFVELIRAVDDGKDFDFDAHVTGMLNRMLDANEENIQKAAESAFRKYDKQGGVKKNRVAQ